MTALAISSIAEVITVQYNDQWKALIDQHTKIIYKYGPWVDTKEAALEYLLVGLSSELYWKRRAQLD